MRASIVFIFCICLTTVSCHTKSEADKIADIHYNAFKKKVNDDQFDVTAQYDAKQVIIFSSDSERVREARQWLNGYENHTAEVKASDEMEKREKSIFVSKTFTVEKVLDRESGCNRVKINYLIHPYTDNKDSLLKATKIFTDSVYSRIPYQDGCSPLKCILGFYDGMKDYDLERWLLLGRRLMGNEAEVEYSYWR